MSLQTTYRTFHTSRVGFLAAALAAACFSSPGLIAQSAPPAAQTPSDTSAPTSTGNVSSDKAVRLTEVEVTEGRASALTEAPVDRKLDAIEPKDSLPARWICSRPF